MGDSNNLIVRLLVFEVKSKLTSYVVLKIKILSIDVITTDVFKKRTIILLVK